MSDDESATETVSASPPQAAAPSSGDGYRDLGSFEAGVDGVVIAAIIMAILSVVGGLIVGLDQSQTTDILDEETHDWSVLGPWLIAGFAGAVAWFAIAVVVVMLRGIWRDVRRIREAGTVATRSSD